jgi:hypothetical protein
MDHSLLNLMLMMMSHTLKPAALLCCPCRLALCVQVYLKMDRPDKAEQQVKAMSAIDDDATVTQLATAWVGVALGGGKVQEASYIYQELGDKFSWTVSMLGSGVLLQDGLLSNRNLGILTFVLFLWLLGGQGMGGGKVQKVQAVSYVCQELGDKFTWTAKFLHAVCVAH